MSKAYTLIVDQGTHATRAFAFDEESRIRISAYVPVALDRLSADKIEQDAVEIVNSMHQVVQSVLADETVRRHGVAQAGVATQRSSVVAWDRKSGEPLAPMLSWQDRRAAGWLSQFDDQAQAIKARTGLPLSPHYGASKLRWLLDNVPAVQEARQEGRLAFGPLASFLLFHLLREQPLLVDHANAARTQLWHIDSRDWDPWLLDLFGVPRSPLPECCPIVSEYGVMQAADIAVTAVNGDQNAAVYSLGQPKPGTAIVNLGTGAFVLMPTGGERVRHPQLLSGLASSDAQAGDYTIEGTVNGAGAALSWAAEQWGIGDVQQNLDDWLQRPSVPPIFLNSIGGLGSPFWRPGPKPAIVGEGEPWQRMVAVAESILFLLQANLEAMRAAGLTTERIQISGGLARSDALCQRLADLTGTVVYRPMETEATARGAAWLAAGRPSYWPELEPGKQFEPRPDSALADRYQQFRRAIEITD
ncbi:MAG TPA: FGGY family carbohydrate kinase [Anaerolineae bacterium]